MSRETRTFPQRTLCHHLLILLLIPPLSAVSFPHSQIHPLLHDQALSHLAFHSNPLKLSLSNLFTPPRTVAIVGVEWGQDLALFAEHNFHVYAIEPVPKFLTHLRQLIHDHPHWNVTILPFAASNLSDHTLHLQYDNENVDIHVPTARMDDHIKQSLAVYSLDIQGDEWQVLQGSTQLLSTHSVNSLWIEAIACNPSLTPMLQFLDSRYVIFDFVPWGKHTQDPNYHSVPRTPRSFVFDPQRPSQFDSYLSWLCTEKRRAYHWLQTDFLAVKRDVLTDHVVRNLSGLADQVCVGDHPADCLLRNLLLTDFDNKDEL